LLNDLDVSASHMDRLVKDLISSPVIPQTFPAEEVEAARTSISSFLSIVPKFQSTLRVGVEQLFNQLLRPKLRTLLADVYKEVSYVLDDDAYAAAEYQDVVRKRFIKAWGGLAEGYKVRHDKNKKYKAKGFIRMIPRTHSPRITIASFLGLHWMCSSDHGKSWFLARSTTRYGFY
jgi:hypothetical protein